MVNESCVYFLRGQLATVRLCITIQTHGSKIWVQGLCKSCILSEPTVQIRDLMDEAYTFIARCYITRYRCTAKTGLIMGPITYIKMLCYN